MMRQNIWRSAMGMAAAAMLAVCGAATFSSALADPPQDAKPVEKMDLAKVEKRDLIIFNTGKTVEGVVLEETAVNVKFLVIIGTMRSPATYSKSEILEIKHNEFKPAEADKGDKKDEKKDETVAASAPSEPGKLVDGMGKPIDPSATKVYMVTLRGEIGHDVSKTPMKAVMDDVVRIQPDILVVRFENEFAQYGEKKQDFEIDTMQYDMLDKARELDTLLTDRVQQGGEFKNKPRMVAWIKKALGGAAFLPFTFKEIYFTSDGLHGGLGALEILFQGRGDEIVRQKQRSLRLARAVGLAEKGGHDGRIMRAMSLAEYILSYRIVGGQIEFLDGKMPPDPEWYLLKDDGAINKDHGDSMQDVLRFKGNDFLTLDAKTAFDIGFSNGTADTPDELLGKMGVTRNYALVKNKSDQIFGDWSREVGRTEREVEKLLAAYRAVQVKPPGQYEQRTAYRGQRKAILRQVQSAVKQYAEAINPQAVGDPEQVLGQIDVAIDRIETEQRLDRRP